MELADLSSLRDVRELAGRLSRLDRLDVLINNAGLVLARRQVSADGFEYTFALNHLAPFLLTGLLREKLAASAPARVITVSSAAHRAARLDLADLQLTGHFNGWRAYANSKLANILFTRELASRLTGTGVTANCVHPGTVNTRFGRGIGRRFLLSAAQGADTVVYLASSPDVAGATGGYYIKRRLRAPSGAARDPATARRLWAISAELTGRARGGGRVSARPPSQPVINCSTATPSSNPAGTAQPPVAECARPTSSGPVLASR